MSTPQFPLKNTEDTPLDPIERLRELLTAYEASLEFNYQMLGKCRRIRRDYKAYLEEYELRQQHFANEMLSDKAQILRIEQIIRVEEELRDGQQI